MPRTILVPLDGSASAEQAFNYAAVIAQPVSSELLFFRAVPTTGSATASARAYDRALIEEAQSYLDGFVHRARARGLRADAVLSEDEAGAALLAAARDHGTDMIVMTTHGRGGQNRVIYGSMAQTVISQTTVPVFMVPRDAEPNWVPDRTFRLVVSLDGSALAEQALPAGRALARALSAHMILVRAVDPHTWITGDGEWSLADPTVEAEKYLASWVARISEEGIPAQGHVGQGPAARVIRKAAREFDAQAIVMSSHGQSGLAPTLAGAVTEAVLGGAHVPVAIVRPPAVIAYQQSANRGPWTAMEGRTVLVAMTSTEIELTERALRQLIAGSVDERNVSRAARLLARIQQVRGVEAPHEGLRELLAAS
jgi:nucleotide-binding universal stress UspA family protein